MSQRVTDHRPFYLVVGLIAGLAIAYTRPHEPAYAAGSDSSDQVAITTCTTGLGGAEAVFVLDFTTGRLVGAALSSQTGQITQSYLYNVAADFGLTERGEYVMTSGHAELPRRGQTPAGNSVIWVAEMKSGRVMGYAFPYTIQNRKTGGGPMPLARVDGFSFREGQ